MTSCGVGVAVVAGQGFVGMNLTIVNTAGPHKFQAVALRNSADQSTFYSCSIEGYQDTLYIHTHRQFYRDCDIYGTIDYIFGNGSAVLQNCNIYVRKPLTGHSTIITAHGRTDPNQNTGFSIHNCNVLPTPDLAASNARARRGRKTKTFLGRPWRDYCRVIFMQSYMDEFVDSVGWHRWDRSNFGLRDSYMAEFDNWGAGSHTTKRAKWLAVHLINATEAQHFTVSSFINGDLWLPKTGVPYTGGLV
ncbi:probable pectinesterase/pectinesterase inhibitor 20 [Humulus lupulus]|uniref:probable pectinesterase/pectinesterase inhibitor 20 n=1 Tax=Humulus lupulus TaxID=3486 RepID=UPI002B402422|nr:probable pectinesterase/pectinesterase inhibitor 20 [Humulus lupulus]